MKILVWYFVSYTEKEEYGTIRTKRVKANFLILHSTIVESLYETKYVESIYLIPISVNAVDSGKIYLTADKLIKRFTLQENSKSQQQIPADLGKTCELCMYNFFQKKIFVTSNVQ